MQIWKRCQVKYEAKSHIFWIIGKGNINISKDKWLPMSLPQVPNLEYVHDLFCSSITPNDEMISEVYDPTVASMIQSMNITLSNQEDKPIWVLNPDRKFTIASAWNTIRHKGPYSFIRNCGPIGCPSVYLHLEDYF